MIPEEIPYDGQPGTSRGGSRPSFLEDIALRWAWMPRTLHLIAT